MHHQVRLDLTQASLESLVQPIHDEGDHHRLVLWAYYPGAHVIQCELLAALDQLEQVAHTITRYAEAHRRAQEIPQTTPLPQRLVDLAQLAELFGQAIETYAHELERLAPSEAQALREAGRLYAQHVMPAFRQAALAVQEVAP